ncbi:hypothetical protein AURDEDRAFT_150204 [Auricularia subglabra TFB-10046 SS5]|nr:hypothetical protein AURDEDRAFT_150204 [Auricularia subglabra TFB-10046 SS5]
MQEPDFMPLEHVAHLGGHRRTYSANRLALAWTQSWQGLQLGERRVTRPTGHVGRLQANAISESTGLFLGSATALRHAGPGGTLVGYSITGTMVLCVTKSLAQMVSCFPRSGGPVGLSHLYVGTYNPALAFALGWNAWYNWTIIIPAEIAAAGVLMNTFFPKLTEGSEMQKHLNVGWTVGLIALALAVNLLGSRFYGKLETRFSIFKVITIFAAWIDTMDLIAIQELAVAYSVSGQPVSRILVGWCQFQWSSEIAELQSLPSGTEVTVMAVAEVKNPKIHFDSSGNKSIPKAARGIWIRMLGPTSNDPKSNYAFTSPFVIGFLDAGGNGRIGAYLFAALFVLSALSAAISDVFISSRFLFFMSKCGHAPRWCSHVWNVQRRRIGIIPWAGVAVAGAFATLAFMTATDAEQAFHWLSTMTSTAALCSWIGMMWTYVTWIRGLKKARRDPAFNWFFDKYEKHIPRFRWYHEPRAWYALGICILILLLNGWAVFTVPGPWIVARIPGQHAPPVDPDIGPPVPTFVSSYVPVPMFLLLIFGYKLINRTTVVTTEMMVQNMALEWDQADREAAVAAEQHAPAQTPAQEQPTKPSFKVVALRVYKVIRQIL